MKGIFIYQAILVLAPKVEEKDRETIFKKFGDLAGAAEAKIAKSEHLGMKELVYEIEGNRKGDFWQLDIESAKPVKLSDLNIFLNRENNIIRYLILKK